MMADAYNISHWHLHFRPMFINVKLQDFCIFCFHPVLFVIVFCSLTICRVLIAQ